MIGRFFENLLGGRQNVFWFVFLIVTAVLAGSSFWVINFIANVDEDDSEMMAEEMMDGLSPIYVDYFSEVDEYISPEAYLAMAAYDQQFDEVQNVEVLEGLSSQEMIGYMINHVSGGLQVNCDYCHSLQNFAADEWEDEEAMANKASARIHLQLVQDLNREWLSELASLTDQKQPSGSQITCATCHYGVAQPQVWPEDQVGLPDDFRLPLEDFYSLTEEDLLNVNAREDISLDAVQYNQQVMYHMNSAMNVGCTHCHNSRYFPSWEVPAKYYAGHMLLMSQFIWAEYAESMGNQQPSCTMCHNGAVIPGGSAVSVDVMPAPLVPVPQEAGR
ncbi:MAG: photosynthetic reaction center cytochrome c subunit [Chloroflexi bacterium]|nr:photosynthetic reaction center cytochrome c subunit [Chloroflexota bacterium]